MERQGAGRRVPLLDLRAQHERIKDEIQGALERVIQSQQFILGPEVEALEQELAAYCGCRFSVGVSSGTDALIASLMAIGVGPGDEVITTPFSFFATAGAVVRLGARVVFVDIDATDFNIDPRLIPSAVTRKTKAIIPVHLFGQCADMNRILDVGRQYGLAVIEDAAQAIGSEYHGKRAGSMGVAGCFSFFPSKNLGGFGDGGIVTTNDEELADKLRIIRNQGSHPKYYHRVLGGNFRLDSIQAAVLRVKLKHLEEWTGRRRVNASYYSKRFLESGVGQERVTTPSIVRERHVFNQYVIRASHRDTLRSFLSDNGVTTEIYYPLALHLQECISDGRYSAGDFPVSEKASAEVLALPIYPELTVEDKEYIIELIRDFYLRKPGSIDS